MPLNDFVSLGEAASRVVDNLRTQTRPDIEVWPITDRAAWLARRQNDVTASDIGALLGVHDYNKTPYRLWARKSGLESEDSEETPAMIRGRLMEPVAVNLLREMHPSWNITTPNKYYRDPSARLGATPDAFASDPLKAGFGVIQIKTVGAITFQHKWRCEDGTIECPLWIAAQAIVEAHLTGASWAMVAPMRMGEGGLDLDEIEIPLHAELIARIESEVTAFWRAVETRCPPDPDLHCDAELIERLYNPEAKIIDLSSDNFAADLVDERERLGEQAKYAKERRQEIKTELLLKLDGAGAGRLADGRVITAKRTQRAGYTVRPTEFVDIRIKKGRTI